MTSRVAPRQRHRLLGLWLALLALCALNLQGFEHYQRMLVADAICSAASGDVGKGAPQTGSAHSVTDCALSCAQAQSMHPGSNVASLPLVAVAARAADATQAGWPQPPGWRAHQPRAPPALG